MDPRPTHQACGSNVDGAVADMGICGGVSGCRRATRGLRRTVLRPEHVEAEEAMRGA